MEKYFLQKENMEKYIFALFLFKKKIKNGKIFFAEGKRGKIYLCTFFLEKKWKKYVLQKEKMEIYFLCMFFYFWQNKNWIFFATKVVCIVLAGGHSETLGDYFFL